MSEPSRPIVEQAALYFAQSRSETIAQRRARETWIAEEAEHARAYEEAQRMWVRMGDFQDDPLWQARTAARLASFERAHRSRRRGWLLAAAAVLVLLLGSAYLVVWFTATTPPLNYATRLGERRTEILRDGTHVVLNTDSEVEVRYTRSRREVALQHGEAQFEVTHDATRPFIVNTGEGTVTAIGTRFQVRRDKDAATVTLLEGKVEVVHGEERRVLRPNEQARLSDANGIQVSTVNPKQVDGWLSGWLFFHDMPLSQAVAEANRYSPHKLRLGDPKLASLPLNGNFRSGDNATIAAAAAQTLPVKVVEQGADIVLWPK